MPNDIPYRQMIKTLVARRDALDTQIKALEDAARAQESLEEVGKQKRKRERSPETARLEGYVRDAFRQVGGQPMKLIDAIRAVQVMYPENEREEEEKLRDRFHNLKKSGFLTSEGVVYGHIKLTKGVRAKKNGETQENVENEA